MENERRWNEKAQYWGTGKSKWVSGVVVFSSDPWKHAKDKPAVCPSLMSCILWLLFFSMPISHFPIFKKWDNDPTKINTLLNWFWQVYGGWWRTKTATTIIIPSFILSPQKKKKTRGLVEVKFQFIYILDKSQQFMPKDQFC